MLGTLSGVSEQVLGSDTTLCETNRAGCNHNCKVTYPHNKADRNACRHGCKTSYDACLIAPTPQPVIIPPTYSTPPEIIVEPFDVGPYWEGGGFGVEHHGEGHHHHGGLESHEHHHEGGHSGGGGIGGHHGGHR